MIALTQTYTAVGLGLTSSFQGTGGTGPYAYSVIPGGAGGTINSSTGIYTAPGVFASSNPNSNLDTVQVIDSLSAVATSQILVARPLLLFCDVIQKFMGLDNSHCFLWDQKWFLPNDYGLYVIISEDNPKPFGNKYQYDGVTPAIQTVNMYCSIGIEIVSRGPSARDQKELVIAALQSQYSQQQQEKNSFYIGKISTNFVNLSSVDGSAIPYRFRISVALQYTITVNPAAQYFNTFAAPSVYTNP
jgi:hypothetical protein